jgi:SAM-dependent methyltransferase
MPPPAFAPVCDPLAPCKCCGTPATLFGVVDSSKSCEDRRGRVFPPSGVPVYYHRCPRCGFLFTAAMDAFTPDDFRALVYDAGYALVDPDFREARPAANAALLSKLFPARPASVLDYGGGAGALAGRLRAAGFPSVRCFDPFVPGFDARPEGRYDLVCAFEVAEHSTDPAGVFADMASLLADPGLILFSTLLQPPDIGRQGLGWWYVGPRNGHVSLFTRPALRELGARLGLRLASRADNLHLFCRTPPAFARHLLPRG